MLRSRVCTQFQYQNCKIYFLSHSLETESVFAGRNMLSCLSISFNIFYQNKLLYWWTYLIKLVTLLGSWNANKGFIRSKLESTCMITLTSQREFFHNEECKGQMRNNAFYQTFWISNICTSKSMKDIKTLNRVVRSPTRYLDNTIYEASQSNQRTRLHLLWKPPNSPKPIL